MSLNEISVGMIGLQLFLTISKTVQDGSHSEPVPKLETEFDIIICSMAMIKN